MSRSQPDNEDFRWLLDALGGFGAGQPSDVLARPSADKPELFLPLGTAGVASAALRRYHDGRTRADRIKTTAAIAVASSGLLRFAPGDRVELAPFRLVEELAETMGVDKLHAAVTLGPRRRNRKPVLQLIRSDGTTAGFAKIGWSPFTRSLVDNEAKWLDRLVDKTPTNVEIPRVLTRIDTDERLVVVMTPLATSPRSGADGTLRSSSIIELARAVGTNQAPFGELDLLNELRHGRAGELIDIEALVERHGQVEVETGMWHGDLTPWNTSTAGGVSLIWDWEFADDGRPVGFDLLHNAFERVRRSAPRHEAEALRSLRNEARAILEPLGQPTDAVVDLYLCELIQREARLRGEGWAPADLGPLETHAVAALRERMT